MTREQAIKALQQLEDDDPPNARVDADLVVIDFLESNGFPDVAKALLKASYNGCVIRGKIIHIT